MDTAPRSETSSSGSSSRAVSDAEYTLAPDSLTTTTPGADPSSPASADRTARSVSLDAVPLPMAISSGPCSRTRARSPSAKRSSWWR